jgi:hypothetical protein
MFSRCVLKINDSLASLAPRRFAENYAARRNFTIQSRFA